MGACYGKSIPKSEFLEEKDSSSTSRHRPRTTDTQWPSPARTPSHHHARTPSQHHHQRTSSYSRTPSHSRNHREEEKKRASKFWASPFYSPSPVHGFFSFHKKFPSHGAGGSGRSPSRGGGSSSATPKRHFKLPFPPPSPAKHIRAVLARRHGTVKPNEGAGAGGMEDGEGVVSAAGLDRSFGFLRNFAGRYELGEEVGRGHFGYTRKAQVRNGELKGQQVAVKVIPKAKLNTAIAIEDVRKEVKILRDLTGYPNLIQFHDAYEDGDNVYIIMEFCEGGELLDRILSRGGKYSEDDAKVIVVQILNVVAFFHLQGVVHRDLKPENFLFTSEDDNSQLKVIDFGLSDFVKPEERLNDIVGSAYYVAPEVLHRSYSTEADVWSIGVIVYILLCGSRPFWARTESGIFRVVLKADPSFNEPPWSSLSYEAKDFVKHLLSKDPRRRMSAAQALSHRWIRSSTNIKMPLDILLFTLMKAYIRSSSLRKDALRALSKTLTVDELFYFKEQFALLDPNEGCITLENVKLALMKNATEAMKNFRASDLLVSLSALQYRKMDFVEFCAATLRVHQLESLSSWEQHVRCAYEIFEKDGNKAIVIDELASVIWDLPDVVMSSILIRKRSSYVYSQQLLLLIWKESLKAKVKELEEMLYGCVLKVETLKRCLLYSTLHSYDIISLIHHLI